ncbi:uncharacterized protein LOC128669915 [Plodia interpunctella]|uniref:uncharacterized protein LOC128669915 n=1 Tax=Plodia interpunctella TaxID=58824 RepID=UPI0023675ADA|nr:uncharacterized protein LOC128669915 [Plodia interpunctella]
MKYLIFLGLCALAYATNAPIHELTQESADTKLSHDKGNLATQPTTHQQFDHLNTTHNLRKHYGLSHYKCQDKVKTFKCLAACKSHGYQIFRISTKCECSCFDLRRPDVLPFFKWRTTTDVTKSFPKTHSVSLYHIIGTLSPFTEEEEESTTMNTTIFTCPTLPAAAGSSETTDGDGNTTMTDDTTDNNATTDAGSTNSGNDTTDDKTNAVTEDGSTTESKPPEEKKDGEEKNTEDPKPDGGDANPEEENKEDEEAKPEEGRRRARKKRTNTIDLLYTLPVQK